MALGGKYGYSIVLAIRLWVMFVKRIFVDLSCLGESFPGFADKLRKPKTGSDMVIERKRVTGRS